MRQSDSRMTVRPSPRMIMIIFKSTGSSSISSLLSPEVTLSLDGVTIGSGVVVSVCSVVVSVSGVGS